MFIAVQKRVLRITLSFQWNKFSQINFVTVRSWNYKSSVRTKIEAAIGRVL